MVFLGAQRWKLSIPGKPLWILLETSMIFFSVRFVGTLKLGISKRFCNNWNLAAILSHMCMSSATSMSFPLQYKVAQSELDLLLSTLQSEKCKLEGTQRNLTRTTATLTDRKTWVYDFMHVLFLYTGLWEFGRSMHLARSGFIYLFLGLTRLMLVFLRNAKIGEVYFT